MTPHNVYEIIKCVETHFHILQGKIAEACTQALEKIENHRVSLSVCFKLLILIIMLLGIS